MREARAFDPLYDTTYTCSNIRDHYRNQRNAAGFHLVRTPVFQNFFSELPHQPAHNIRLDADDKLPQHLSRDAYLQNNTSSGEAPCALVSGVGRYKYSHVPKQATGPGLLPKIRTVSILSQYLEAPHEEEQEEGAHVTTACAKVQTEFRESVAQTDPWDPPTCLKEPTSVKQSVLSALRACPGPEVAELGDLKWSFGEGIRPQDVEEVQKRRAKRAFEASLPPLTTDEDFRLRQQRLEEYETAEWEDHERDLLERDKERLLFLQTKFAQETAKGESERQKLLLRHHSRRQKDIRKRAGQITHRKAAALRHLQQGRMCMKALLRAIPPSLVEQYADFGSKIYAPLQRHGRVADVKQPSSAASHPIEVENMGLPALTELSGTLDSILMKRESKPSHPHLKPPTAADVYVEQQYKVLEESKAAARGRRGFGECWPCPLEEDDSALETESRSPMSSLRRDGSTGAAATESNSEKARAAAASLIRALLISKCREAAALSRGPDASASDDQMDFSRVNVTCPTCPEPTVASSEVEALVANTSAAMLDPLVDTSLSDTAPLNQAYSNPGGRSVRVEVSPIADLKSSEKAAPAARLGSKDVNAVTFDEHRASNTSSHDSTEFRFEPDPPHQQAAAEVLHISSEAIEHDGRAATEVPHDTSEGRASNGPAAAQLLQVTPEVASREHSATELLNHTPEAPACDGRSQAVACDEHDAAQVPHDNQEATALFGHAKAEVLHDTPQAAPSDENAAVEVPPDNPEAPARDGLAANAATEALHDNPQAVACYEHAPAEAPHDNPEAPARDGHDAAAVLHDTPQAVAGYEHAPAEAPLDNPEAPACDGHAAAEVLHDTPEAPAHDGCAALEEVPHNTTKPVPSGVHVGEDVLQDFHNGSQAATSDENSAFVDHQ
eukprot:jgi/Botrbrau1/22176/Bobra.168_1s0008.1